MTETLGYQKFIAHTVQDIRKDPRVVDVIDWYANQVKQLPDMKVTDTNLTGQGGWKGELTSGQESGTQEVVQVEGAFFVIRGQKIEIVKPDGAVLRSWVQPGIIQNETPVSLPTLGEEVKASGLVGLLHTKTGFLRRRKMLLAVGQEPFAKTHKRALVRTPVQTSAAKLNAILEGDREKDANLANVLDIVGQGRPVNEMFSSGEIQIFPLSPADPNRIDATNIGFRMNVKGRAMQRKLEEGGNRWCTRREVKALVRAGLVNGHTSALVAAW